MSAAVEHLPSGAVQKLGRVVLSSVDSAIESRWSAAQERAQSLKGESIEEKAKAFGKQLAYEMGTVGAA